MPDAKIRTIEELEAVVERAKELRAQATELRGAIDGDGPLLVVRERGWASPCSIANISKDVLLSLLAARLEAVKQEAVELGVSI